MSTITPILFWCQIFSIPTATLNKVIKICSDFMWKGNFKKHSEMKSVVAKKEVAWMSIILSI